MKPSWRTVAQAMQAGLSAGLSREEVSWLLSSALTRDRAWLWAHEDTVLSPVEAERVADWIARRADGVPLAYLRGTQEFHGLTLSVTPDTLVPRADTETLVDWALALLNAQPAPRVIDLGTGSGAIALALGHRCPRAEVHATDASEAALRVARRNADQLGLTVAFHRADWWRGVPAGPFTLAVSNPPYIAPHDAHLPALRHEPRSALVAKEDGLADLNALIDAAPPHLAPGAWVLLEHGHDQAVAVRQRLTARGFCQVQSRPDLAGIDRVSAGCWR